MRFSLALMLAGAAVLIFTSLTASNSSVHGLLGGVVMGSVLLVAAVVAFLFVTVARQARGSGPGPLDLSVRSEDEAE